MSTPAFRSHPRTWEENLYVYPVLSRRARGLSVGINLSPHKACNMDCVYCQVDRSVPGPTKRVDLARVEHELDALLASAVSGRLFTMRPFRDAPASLLRLADVAFSGDGEPTSFRGFHEACRIAVRAKTGAGVPNLPVRIITNAVDLCRDEVVSALAYLDDHAGEVWAKLDAGTEEAFRRVARAAAPLSRVVGNILRTAKLRPVVIQSLFFRDHGRDPAEEEVLAWVERLREILEGGGRVSLVQVHTVARTPAEGWVSPASAETLAAIADRVREELGVPAEVY